MGATIMYSLSKNYFVSNLFPFLSFFLVFSTTILLHGEPVYADRYNYSCDSNSMTLWNVDDNQTARTYTISGSCKQEYFSDYSDYASVGNWKVNITAIWNKSGRQAIETVISDYGQLIRTFQCDYDPWLDPVSKCTITSHEHQRKYGTISDDEAWWPGYEDMNYRQSFPTSTLAFNQQNRKELVSQAMARSLRIIEPVADQFFDNNEVRVTVIMERPVRNPPDSQVSIKVEEKPSWPEPGVTATNRKYELSKNYQITENEKLLATYFNLKDLDLWGGKWLAKAHLLVADTYWTPTVSFSVRPSEQLELPPEKQLFPEVKPTTLSQFLHKSLSHRLFIMSPQVGQSVFGDLTLKIELWGYPEATASDGPEITLDWTWSPFSNPGEVPPTPKTMEVRPSMQGTELVIPRSVFTKHGIWSVTATIKESENKIISDRVSFKIRDLISPAGRGVHLNPATLEKIKQTAVLPTKNVPIKPLPSKTPTLPQKNLQAPEKPEPKVQADAIALQQRTAPTAVTALKTAPTIIRPQENEHFDKPGPVQISARVSAAGAGLVWEVEYQAFNAPSFVRQRQPSTGSLTAGGGMVKMARLSFPAPGTYRFRAKEDGNQARWSPWRTIVVGSKPVPIPAVKTAPLQEKPALSRDALKPETTQKKISPTETPANKMPSPATNQLEQVKPATINQQKKPTLKPIN